MLTDAAIKEFRESLRGVIIEPQDKGYDEARKVYNAMIDRRPRIIAMCADVADVKRSVNFARNNNMLLSVRGGGHNAGGLGICDDCLVIDMSGIKYTRVDPVAKTVVVGGGCTWGDVDHATHEFGLANPSGILSTTGVGGLTLGGGIGHLTRNLGLTIDNLLSVDMVLADGSFVTADKDNNQELFWAVRGGGGNFGVVTAFTFRLHQIDMVYAGPILYHIDKAETVLKWYRNFIHEAPKELNGFFAFLTVPPGPPFPEPLHLKKMCGIVWTYSGPMEKAEDALKPVRSFLTPDLDLAGPLPYPALQGMFDPLFPKGLQWYWKADLINELSDSSIAEHIKHGNLMPTMLSTMHLYPISGTASKINRKDTAWNFRDAKWSMVIVGVDPDPANKDKIVSWAKQYWEALHPYSAGGVYLNFIGDEGEERVKASYGENYERLVSIKNKYDPQNLFRVNQNIKPNVNVSAQKQTTTGK